PYFGRIADRYDRRRLWIGCDLASAVPALAVWRRIGGAQGGGCTRRTPIRAHRRDRQPGVPGGDGGLLGDRPPVRRPADRGGGLPGVQHGVRAATAVRAGVPG